jgi:hypothetical protein
VRTNTLPFHVNVSVLHSFQLSEFSKGGELHLAPDGQVASLTAEADFPSNRWAMMNNKSPESSQLD